MSNLVVRTITGTLFVVLLVGCILGGSLPFALLFAVITALTTWEFASNVNRHDDCSVNAFICSVASVYMFFAFAGYCSELVGAEVFIPYLLTVIYLLVSELYRQQPHPLKNWGYAFASQIYVALPMALLTVLAFRFDPFTGSTRYEYIFPLSVFIFLWVSDSGAYVTGSCLHKYFPAKLFPRISPAKSWVGSIGGGVFCIFASVVLWHFFPDKMNLQQWIGMAVVVCVFGTWGDLVESLFKRQLGVKDSGKILPGHGGMLDRFDSSLIAIPAVVIYFYSIKFLAL